MPKICKEINRSATNYVSSSWKAPKNLLHRQMTKLSNCASGTENYTNREHKLSALADMKNIVNQKINIINCILSGNQSQQFFKLSFHDATT